MREKKKTISPELRDEYHDRLMSLQPPLLQYTGDPVFDKAIKAANKQLKKETNKKPGLDL